MIRLRYLVALTTFLFATVTVNANIDPNRHGKSANEITNTSLRAECLPAESQTDLAINNVRARLLTGGDIWWDLQEGKYIVPKPPPGFPEVSSIFAGGVWIGGVDAGGSIKLCAVTYRRNSQTDYYAGPLDQNGITELEICQDWDQFFKVLGSSVLNHINKFDELGMEYSCDSIPQDVRYWPGKGNPYWSEKYDFELPDQPLGAFWDEDGDGIYNPCNGDFPNIDIRGCEPPNRKKAKELVPDEMIFWIYNDNGGVHRLSTARAIQMEVQVQSFAYATNDEVNDMTFYRYKLINKAAADIRDCYFAMWVDPDLGCAFDDYIGCDVGRSMAYVYNVDDVDGIAGGTSCSGTPTYGTRVPILGVDYFRGPRGPKVFLRDNDNDIVYDTTYNENGSINKIEPVLINPTPGTGDRDTLVEIGMSSFMYMNNCGSGSPAPQTCDPSSAQNGLEFYNVLRGLWIDGTPLTFGGNGLNEGSTDTVRYAFPGAPNAPNDWSMCQEGLEAGDRRTLQATGPLLLQPSETNELIIGAVWVPDIDYPCPDITRLQFADDIAQALFDNCFDITDGPDAPDMCAVELDRQLILTLTNDENTSNNAFEEYSEPDLQAPALAEDTLYRFEGYKIFQLVNASVTPQELNNIEKAVLIRQVDIKNNVAEIYNWTGLLDPINPDGVIINIPTLEVDSKNDGVLHSFNVIEDVFASGADRKLVNHRPYHFMVLAYAFNEYEPFNSITGFGQSTPYLEGRRNVKVYSYTPRPIIYNTLNAAYGEGAEITRIDGIGTGGQFIDLADGQHEAILDGSSDGKLVYKEGAGPLDVKIFDPLSISEDQYKIEVVAGFDAAKCKLTDEARWKLTNLSTGEVIAADNTLKEINEQLIYGHGFSINMSNLGDVGTAGATNNGAIGATSSYANPNGEQWFAAITDGGGGLDGRIFDYVRNAGPGDAADKLSRLGDGTFVPFSLTKYLTPTGPQSFPFFLSPGWQSNQFQGLLFAQMSNGQPFLQTKNVNNIDVVLTSDKSKWSRCIVVETGTNSYTTTGFATEGGVGEFDLRAGASINKDGQADGDGTGMSWFPGYAIDVLTGDRLNIFFGENSVYSSQYADLIVGENVGADMIWNPTPQAFTSSPDPNAFTPFPFIGGGQQYIYVTRQKYDECAQLRTMISNNLFTKLNALSSITWTCFPLSLNDDPMVSPMKDISEGLIPNDITFKVRVNKDFNYEKEFDVNNLNNCATVGGLPSYEFSFSGKAAQELTKEQYSSALANIRIVPNPYYAYSAYETSQFTNTIKVTNLPAKATITIYSMDGKFIKQFRRAETAMIKGGSNPASSTGQVFPDLEWDMKNNKGIPVASGVYLFHIEAPDLGEEITLKWFGINRKFDPSGL